MAPPPSSIQASASTSPASFTWQLDRRQPVVSLRDLRPQPVRVSDLPTQVSSLTTFQQNRSFLLPATSPYYPHDFARAFGVDGTPLNIYWSAIDLGPRTIAPITEQWNVVAGMRGTAMGWTYDGAFNYSRSDVDQQATDGYVRESTLMPILNSGVVNPFGTEHAVDRRPHVDSESRRDAAHGHVEHHFARLPGIDRNFHATVGAGFGGRRSNARRERVTQTSVPRARVRRCPQSRFLAVIGGYARRLGAVRRVQRSSRPHLRGQFGRQVRSLQ